MIDLIKDVDLILNYFVSGFIFLGIFTFLTSIKIKESNKILYSIIISYIIKNILNGFLTVTSFEMINDTWSFIVTLIISFVVSLLISWFVNGKYLKWTFKAFGYKSTHDSIWRDIIDLKNGTELKIFLNNEISYLGKLYCLEERGKDSFIVLTEYIVKYPNDKKFDTTETEDLHTLAVINLQQVNRIETYYINNDFINS